jgi:MoaA/NifB/PqqE/SkfB family radical SAM enzyme
MANGGPQPPDSTDVLIRTVCIKVHRYCDLACSHCWTESSPRATDALTSNLILSFAASMRELGLTHVSLSGGEPLLFPDLQTALQGLWRLGLIVTITTNGFNRKMLDKALRFVGSQGLPNTRFRVSIDGSPIHHEHIRGPGTYAPALEAVGNIRRTFNWVGVNTMVNKSVLPGVERLCADLVNAQVDHWAFITEAPRGNLAGSTTSSDETFAAIEELEKIARGKGYEGAIEKWNYLTAPHTYLLVEPDGRILIPGTTEDEDILLGNVAGPNLTLIGAALKELVARNAVTFFRWEHDRYFGRPSADGFRKQSE